MNHHSWVLLDTETNGITAPIYVVEIGAQKMKGWLPDGPPFRRLLNHNADISPEASRVNGYTREILERDPTARVVFLTTFSDDEYIVSALKLGARGYLIKTDVAAIPPALAQVMDGKRVLEGKAIEDINFDGADVEAGATRRPAAFAGLTDREFEVAELIARGLDNKEIAATAYMGEGTVRNHISSILAKMGLRNRTQIAIAYLRG